MVETLAETKASDIKEKKRKSSTSRGKSNARKSTIPSSEISFERKERRNSRWSWLEDTGVEGRKRFTFPQVKPSLLLYEDPSSLDHKVPIVPGPQDVVVLSTTTLGTKRFQIPPEAEFDLTDPYIPPPEYNFLHDPHLNDYLTNPAVKKRLLEKGLITGDGFVKCTIKEFNDYRQWIRKLKLDALDQQWRLTHKAENASDATKTRNTEAIQLTKERHERAKILYAKKEKNKQKERERYMQYLEENNIRVERMKKDRQKSQMKLSQVRKKEREEKIKNHQREEDSGKKIRIRILMKKKGDIEERENRIQSLHHDESKEKEKKAFWMWKRKQAYMQERMKRCMQEKEENMKARKVSITQRENVFQWQRKNTDAFMIQQCQQNRENALRHLEEASEFMSRIDKKKEEEIKKWRMKLQRAEEREKLIDYYRSKRKYSTTNKFKRHNPKSRQSVWDVDAVLLKELMESFTEEEQAELEELNTSGNASPSIPETIPEDEEAREEAGRTHQQEDEEKKDTSLGTDGDGENADDTLEICDDEDDGDAEANNSVDDEMFFQFAVEGCEKDLEDDQGDKKEEEAVSCLGLLPNRADISRSVSFMNFGRIDVERVVPVYTEDAHAHVKCDNNGGFMDVPGIMIQHTQSKMECPPVIDARFEFYDDMNDELDEVEQVISQVMGEVNEDSAQPDPPTRYSSYEVIVVPKQQKLDEDGDLADETPVTLIHVVDDVPVHVSSSTMHKSSESRPLPILTESEHEHVRIAARAIVQISLGNAAKELGFDADMIQEEIGIDFDHDLEHEHESHYYDAHVYGEGACLGQGLGVHRDVSRRHSAISGHVSHFMSERSYSQMSSLPASTSPPQPPPTEPLVTAVASHEIVSEAKKMAKLAIFDAASRLGYDASEIGTAFGYHENDSRPESVREKYDEFVHNVTEIAIRNAATSLGYSQEEIDILVERASPDKEVVHPIPHHAKAYRRLSEPATDIVYVHEQNMNASRQVSHELATGMSNVSREAATDVVDGHQNMNASRQVSHELATGMSNVSQELANLCFDESQNDLKPTTTSFRLFSQNLVTDAIREAAVSLGFPEKIASEVFVKEIQSRQSLCSKASAKSFRSVRSSNYAEDFESPHSVVAHNALRSAALSLGYEREEVNSIIGPEITGLSADLVQSWAKVLIEETVKEVVEEPLIEAVEEVPVMQKQAIHALREQMDGEMLLALRKQREENEAKRVVEFDEIQKRHAAEILEWTARVNEQMEQNMKLREEMNSIAEQHKKDVQKEEPLPVTLPVTISADDFINKRYSSKVITARRSSSMSPQRSSSGLKKDVQKEEPLPVTIPETISADDFIADRYSSKVISVSRSSSMSPQRSSSSLELDLDEDVEDEDIPSCDLPAFLAREAICSASLELGYTREEISRAITRDESRQSMEAAVEETPSLAELKIVSTQLVSSIFQKAVKIVEEEDKAYTAAFALKFANMVIGSAALKLGYNEEQIISAIEKDIGSKENKDRDQHGKVGFNEIQICRQRRESLKDSNPFSRQRRASIQERPSTPKPSLDLLKDLSEEEDEDMDSRANAVEIENLDKDTCEDNDKDSPSQRAGHNRVQISEGVTKSAASDEDSYVTPPKPTFNTRSRKSTPYISKEEAAKIHAAMRDEQDEDLEKSVTYDNSLANKEVHPEVSMERRGTRSRKPTPYVGSKERLDMLRQLADDRDENADDSDEDVIEDLPKVDGHYQKKRRLTPFFPGNSVVSKKFATDLHSFNEDAEEMDEDFAERLGDLAEDVLIKKSEEDTVINRSKEEISSEKLNEIRSPYAMQIPTDDDFPRLHRMLSGLSETDKSQHSVSSFMSNKSSRDPNGMPAWMRAANSGKSIASSKMSSDMESKKTLSHLKFYATLKDDVFACIDNVDNRDSQTDYPHRATQDEEEVYTLPISSQQNVQISRPNSTRSIASRLSQARTNAGEVTQAEIEKHMRQSEVDVTDTSKNLTADGDAGDVLKGSDVKISRPNSTRSIASRLSQARTSAGEVTQAEIEKHTSQNEVDVTDTSENLTTDGDVVNVLEASDVMISRPNSTRSIASRLSQARTSAGEVTQAEIEKHIRQSEVDVTDTSKNSTVDGGAGDVLEASGVSTVDGVDISLDASNTLFNLSDGYQAGCDTEEDEDRTSKTKVRPESVRSQRTKSARSNNASRDSSRRSSVCSLPPLSPRRSSLVGVNVVDELPAPDDDEPQAKSPEKLTSFPLIPNAESKTRSLIGEENNETERPKAGSLISDIPNKIASTNAASPVYDTHMYESHIYEESNYDETEATEQNKSPEAITCFTSSAMMNPDDEREVVMQIPSFDWGLDGFDPESVKNFYDTESRDSRMKIDSKVENKRESSGKRKSSVSERLYSSAMVKKISAVPKETTIRELTSSKVAKQISERLHSTSIDRNKAIEKKSPVTKSGGESSMSAMERLSQFKAKNATVSPVVESSLSSQTTIIPKSKSVETSPSTQTTSTSKRTVSKIESSPKDPMSNRSTRRVSDATVNVDKEQNAKTIPPQKPKEIVSVKSSRSQEPILKTSKKNNDDASRITSPVSSRRSPTRTRSPSPVPAKTETASKKPVPKAEKKKSVSRDNSVFQRLSSTPKVATDKSAEAAPKPSVKTAKKVPSKAKTSKKSLLEGPDSRVSKPADVEGKASGDNGKLANSNHRKSDLIDQEASGVQKTEIEKASLTKTSVVLANERASLAKVQSSSESQPKNQSVKAKHSPSTQSSNAKQVLPLSTTSLALGADVSQALHVEKSLSKQVLESTEKPSNDHVDILSEKLSKGAYKPTPPPSSRVNSKIDVRPAFSAGSFPNVGTSTSLKTIRSRASLPKVNKSRSLGSAPRITSTMDKLSARSTRMSMIIPELLPLTLPSADDEPVAENVPKQRSIVYETMDGKSKVIYRTESKTSSSSMEQPLASRNALWMPSDSVVDDDGDVASASRTSSNAIVVQPAPSQNFLDKKESSAETGTARNDQTKTEGNQETSDA